MCVGGRDQGGLPPMEKRELGAQPSLSSSLPPDSFLLSCSGPYETSQYREGAQANKQMSWSVCQCVCVCAHRIHSRVCGGKNYHGEKPCSDFLHQNLGRRSEEEKLLLEDTLPFPCAHRQTHTIFYLPPSTPTLLLSNFSRELRATVTSSLQSHN